MTRRIRIQMLAAAGALALACPGWAAAPQESSGANDGERNRLHARLWAAPEAGATWRLGVELRPDPGWHVYWRDPGDTGLAPRIEWRVAGASETALEVAWPTPQAFYEAEADLLSYGYEGPVLLASRAALPEHTQRIEARVDALVCASVCLPAEFRLGIDVPGLPDAAAASAARFAKAAARVPRPQDSHGAHARFELSTPLDHDRPGVVHGKWTLWPCGEHADHCTLQPRGDARGLFPYASTGIRWVAGEIQPLTDAHAYTIPMQGFVSKAATANPHRLAGVVPLQDEDGSAASIEIASDSVALPGSEAPGAWLRPLTTAMGEAGDGTAAPAASGASADIPLGTWLRAALFAWIGGLILNLMPCVLPVLAIKLAALAQLASSNRREQRAHAIAYGLGIEASMLALAALVIGLRSAGHAVGWGFQLQEPRFLVATACLLVAFALNLFGRFEISVDTARLGRLGQDAHGATRSFFDGLLAVVLATPCSAPFLGTAVGFAFASPAPVIVSIFVCIGLGLATPFLLAVAWPRRVQRTPRAGAWTADLRGVLAFGLLATVWWLLWILGRSAGADALVAALGLLLAVAAVAWSLGALQQRGYAHSAVASLGSLLVVTGVGLAAVDIEPTPDSQRSAGATAAVIATAGDFDPQAVRASLRAQRPVFVYFTADWCVTCKVNESTVLSKPRVARELERLGYDVFRGDWTRRDDTIRAALARLGKAGVPVYALYDPAAPEQARLLPELLRLEDFLEALREMAGELPVGERSASS